MKVAPQILVVDDDDAIRRFVTVALERQGYGATEVASGQKAIAACRETPYDLALVDIGLPDMDGMDLLEQLVVIDPNLMVIMLTGVATVETTINALNKGASGYITKPVDMSGLMLHVNGAMERRQLVEDNRRLVQELKSELAQKKRAEDELKKKNRELLLWSRELNCLYGVSHILERRDITLEELFQQLVESIASYWPESEEICTRITYGGKQYCTPNCQEIPPTFINDIVVGKDVLGQLELTYLDETAKPDDPVFLRMETTLLQTIASRLGRVVEYKLSEENKRELEAQLLQTEKMASIGQLAAGVAHEINNPTGFIISNLNTFKEYHTEMARFMSECTAVCANRVSGKQTSTPDNHADKGLSALYQAYEDTEIAFILKDSREMIDECMEGMDRIRRIVLDLKDFAHPGQEAPEFSDLNKNLESVLNIVWNELKYKATIEKAFDPIPHVKCHPQQLNQVFMNLLVNAAQAIEKKGTIHIATRKAGEYVEVFIADNGTGIDEKNVNRIFDPFFTTKEIGKGTGLGLNIAYNIVKKHGGTISVSSVVGEGTAFTIKLPIDGPELQIDTEQQLN